MMILTIEYSISSCILLELNCSLASFPDTTFTSQSSPTPSFNSAARAANPFPKVDAARLLCMLLPTLRLLGQAARMSRHIRKSVTNFIVPIDYDYKIQTIIQRYLQMRFKEDSIADFIHYKLNNPQALEEEMRMIRDRQDCTKKLNDYAKHMEHLKNQYNMYKELLDASVAKKLYLQQNYQENATDLNEKIAFCKEEIEENTRQIKDRENRNEYNRKKYNDFQKDIASRKDKLTEYHLTQLTSLFNKSETLKKSIQQKREKKKKLQEEVMLLKDRERIIENTQENVAITKNKWMMKKNQVQKMREEEARKEKEIREQINNAMSMEKVIYGNFYKRCAQFSSEVRAGLEKLFDRDFDSIQGSNLEEKLEKMVQQLKLNKQALLTYITQKREKYKIGQSLPEPDAQVYNNIVQTKINPVLLVTINKSDFKNNDYLLKEIQDGLASMFQQLDIEKKEALEREVERVKEIQDLKVKVKELEFRVASKTKEISSPTKRSRK